MTSTNRQRDWCFTINNYNTMDELELQEMPFTYLIYGREIGAIGTKHLQGYIYFKHPKRFGGVKEMFGRAHVEPARGTAKQNKAYCSKQHDFVELGTMPNQGKRTDLTKLKERVLRGDEIKHIVREDVQNFQQLRFVELLQKYKPKNHKKMRDVKVYWLYGKTGSGKTWQAINNCESDNTWISGKNLRWWQGYLGEEYVILDDFRGDFCTFHELLRILDRYPYEVEYKGGSAELKAHTIYVTSQFHPSEVYHTREDIGQLLRRITEIKEFRDGTEVGGNTKPRLETRTL